MGPAGQGIEMDLVFGGELSRVVSLAAVSRRELFASVVPGALERLAFDDRLGAVDTGPVGWAGDESFFATLF